jgi:hemoglobin
MKLSIYDRIGGSAGVQAVVEALYSRVLEDPEMARFFDGVDMVQMKRRQRLFMAQLMGGPPLGDVTNLTAAHAHSVRSQGLNDAHYDQLIKYLRAALEDLNFSALLASEIVATIERLRGDVLGQQQRKAA